MLASAVEHYARQRTLTRRALLASRRARYGPLDTLSALVMGAQVLVARDAIESSAAMLDEQGIDTDRAATPVATALVGSANDGRDLRSLLDYSRSEDVTAAAFDLIVVTQLQDTARQAASVALVSTPAATGYTRMLVADSCSRCVVLAGKTYRWNAGFQRHPRCGCRHVPSRESVAGDLTTDPDSYFASLDAATQDKTFTKAGAQAIRDGAAVAQVVNARAGMSTAQRALRGPGDRWTASGRLTRTSAFGQDLYTTTEGMTKRGVAYGARNGKKVRLMPESIYEIADDRADALRLLKVHGYIR